MTMSKPGFSLDLAVTFIESAEPFPVDFERAWRWIGYTKKQNAKEVLLNNFDENIDFTKRLVKPAQGGSSEASDFSRFTVKNPQGGGFEDSEPKPAGRGRPGELIMLSIDCFKSLGMMAGTAKGKQVRRYFLDCERIAKSVTNKLAADIAAMKADQAEMKAMLQQLAAAQTVLPGGELVPPADRPLFSPAEKRYWESREKEWATRGNNQVRANCDAIGRLYDTNRIRETRPSRYAKRLTIPETLQRCKEKGEGKR